MSVLKGFKRINKANANHCIDNGLHLLKQYSELKKEITKRKKAMKKAIVIFSVAACSAAFILSGCSQEDRDEAVKRLSNAGKALNGEVRPNDVEHETPNIVAEQQRKERVRQNTQWTEENQKLHPIEFCQAQLEETAKMEKKLNVQQHKLLLSKVASERKLTDLQNQIKQLSKGIESAKVAYRKAEESNTFPMMLNGYSVSKEKAQQSIIASHNKLKFNEGQIPSIQNNLSSVEKKLKQIVVEQRKIVELRERLQNTLSDLQTRQVIDGEQGIGDALRAIDDAMTAIQTDIGGPNVIDLSEQSEESQRQNEFDAIMSK